MSKTLTNSEKAQKVLDFYFTCNKLKTLVRTGWKAWDAKLERMESVAEHIYGVQMLAIAMYSEFECKVDLKKVLMMLAVHELEEIYIGDFTPFQITAEEKVKRGHEAVEEILKPLCSGDEIRELVFEFDARETEEAKFSYFCDKLEAGLQCKVYEEQGAFPKEIIKTNPLLDDNNELWKIVKRNDMKLAESWLEFWEGKAKYDENFMAVSREARSSRAERK